jgi:hypothetical protein
MICNVATSMSGISVHATHYFVSPPAMPYNITSLSCCPPSGVQKECQRVFSSLLIMKYIKCRTYIRTVEQKKSKLFVRIHGDGSGLDPNQMSLNSIFLSGKQQFAHVFDRETMNLTDDDASSNELLVLKEVLKKKKMCNMLLGRNAASRIGSSDQVR